MSVAARLSDTQRRVARSWAQPVYRSGYLLVGNSLLTAVTGVAFWLLAARLYPAEAVGLNSSAVSAMMLIAGIAQLNLMSSLLRFVPNAGRRAGSLVLPAYAIGAFLSLLAAVAFLLGLRVWAPALQPLLLSPVTAVSFVLAAALWPVWVMQSSVLVAVGHAGATTWTNQLFNGLKAVLLLAFFVVLPSSGVWYAWMAATGVGVLTGTWFLFRRAIPRFGDQTAGAPVQVPSRRDFVRFAGPDYVAALAWIAGTSLTPILVLNLTDARHAAVFALTWQICFVLYGVPSAQGLALVAHAARNPDELVAHHRRTLRTSIGLVAPVVLVLVAFAPLLLRPFGGWYASQGVGTLRLLALSALPNVLVTLAVSRARVERRMATIVAAMTALCLIALLLTWLLVPHIGIVGAAVAWLVGQTVVASAVGLRRLRRAPGRPAVAAPPAGSAA
jgi:O-antigen/teichoic acid export membrane protein